MARLLATDRPSRWEKAGLICLLLVMIAFGALTEFRSAFLSRRMGDAGVFFRTAWAVRSGDDLYTITDENQWHYNYPPLFAILMTPLADAPAGASRAAMLPYSVSIGIWYLLNVCCLGLALHVLAEALESVSPDSSVRNQPVGCRRWLALRAIPFLVCLPPVGLSLMRGQVNTILLLLFALMARASVRQRSGVAGLYLAGSICLKIIPAFLLLDPLWRRDRRMLAFCVLGLVIGLALIPLAVMGPERTVSSYQSLASGVLGPGFGGNSHPDRAVELLNANATESQSLQAILHNTIYLHAQTRPDNTSPAAIWMGRSIGLGLTLITLMAFGWRSSRSGLDRILFLSCLIVCMMLLSPICHLHYFTLCIPLVMCLLHAAWESRTDLSPGLALTALFTFFILANALPNFQGLEICRELGSAMYGVLALWIAGVTALRRSTPARQMAGDLENCHLNGPLGRTSKKCAHASTV